MKIKHRTRTLVALCFLFFAGCKLGTQSSSLREGDNAVAGDASGAKAGEGAAPADILLPGSSFYPEGITRDAQGNLFVGSIGGAGIVRVRAGSTEPVLFIAPERVGPVTGVYVDEVANKLYACTNDVTHLGTAVPVLRSFDLATGADIASYVFPGPGLCNDMTLGPKRTLYVTDSFGRIFMLKDGGNQLELLSNDPLFGPRSQGDIGADGIAWDRKTSLYVTHVTDGTLIRLPLLADGSNGGPAAAVSVAPPGVAQGDGMRLIEEDTFVLAQNTGTLALVRVSGDSATVEQLATGLPQLTAVVPAIGGGYWVTEGQLDRLFARPPLPPTLPFTVHYVSAPSQSGSN